MLAVTAGGQKLSPYVILKWKTVAKEKCLLGIIVRVQESCQMTEDSVKD
jgi:hypothetical protein